MKKKPFPTEPAPQGANHAWNSGTGYQRLGLVAYRGYKDGQVTDEEVVVVTISKGFEPPIIDEDITYIGLVSDVFIRRVEMGRTQGVTKLFALVADTHKLWSFKAKTPNNAFRRGGRDR